VESPDRLLIALEPEAASIYIRRLRKSQLVPDRATMRPLSPSKYSSQDVSVVSLDQGVGEDIKTGFDLYSYVSSVVLEIKYGCVSV